MASLDIKSYKTNKRKKKANKGVIENLKQFRKCRDVGIEEIKCEVVDLSGNLTAPNAFHIQIENDDDDSFVIQIENDEWTLVAEEHEEPEIDQLTETAYTNLCMECSPDNIIQSRNTKVIVKFLIM
jgi:hypothetical protein